MLRPACHTGAHGRPARSTPGGRATGLAATRPAVEAGAPWPLAERFDDSDEARWGPGEVLAHLAEMAPYWLGEIERVLDGDPEPVPFGRIATDPIRIGARRARPVAAAARAVRPDRRAHSTRFDRRWRTLTPDDSARRGLHPTRGELTVAQMPDRFIVGHLADHVAQLETILAGRDRVGLRRRAGAHVHPVRDPDRDPRSGILLGGRLDRLGRAPAPLGAAGPARAGGPGRDLHGRRWAAVGDAGPAIYVASTALVFVAVLRNLAVPGVALIAIGAGCNLAAIVANGGWMPADPARARLGRRALSGGYTNSIVVADPALRPLTDMFALPAWLPLANVFSVGDVLIGVGIAATIALAMRRRRRSGRRLTASPPARRGRGS